MSNILPIPKIQFFDQNGVPLAGGSVGTYIPFTLTQKITYSDINLTMANANPLTLDGSGSASFWGAGQFRFIVNDEFGNLQYDMNTAASAPDSAISTAMLPVTSAATLASAQSAMGLPALINAAVTAGAGLGPTGPAGPTGTGSVGPTGPAGSSSTPVFGSGGPGDGWYIYFPNVSGLPSPLIINFGFSQTDDTGNGELGYPMPFTNSVFTLQCTQGDASTGIVGISAISVSAENFRVITWSPVNGVNNSYYCSAPFAWMAIGY